MQMCAEYLLHRARSTDQPSHAGVSSSCDVGECSSPSEAMKPEFYSVLYEFHGDALPVRLPAMYDIFTAAAASGAQSSDAQSLLGVDPAASQSGEQLLQQFLDPGPRRRDSDRGSVVVVRSERSSSMSSECGDLGDMSVKETVSDPSRGIRLTILKKKPKLQIPEVETAVFSQPKESKTTMATMAAQGRVMKEFKKSPTKVILMQKLKLSLGEVFEDLVSFKRKQDIMFVFKFQGREQRCLPLLPRWGIGGRSTVSWYQVLCRRLPRVAPRARKTPPSSQTKHAHRTRTAGLCSLDLALAVI